MRNLSIFSLHQNATTHMRSFLLLLYYYFLLTSDQEMRFTEQTIDGNLAIGYGLAVGDVDGDKKPDILVADKQEIVWYRNGDWKKFVMAQDLTTHDNVCLAARDIDGDGKVEVAVGAQWNPSETSDTLTSGAVFYLERPRDPTQRWNPVKLHHEPTVHRMKWVRAEGNLFHLVVLPLHGRGNKDGAGKGVRIIAYERPRNPGGKWRYFTFDESMHLTHNLDVREDSRTERIYVGGKEGVKTFVFRKGKWVEDPQGKNLITGESFGELRLGKTDKEQDFLTGIQPMHGNQLTVYQWKDGAAAPARTVITDALKQGHALATADLFNSGFDQIVVGWRDPNDENKVGIRIYEHQSKGDWQGMWLDENGMACEDLLVQDLDGDGKKDIVACGRATRNVKIYWQKK